MLIGGASVSSRCRHDAHSGPTRELRFPDGFGPNQPEQLVTPRRTEYRLPSRLHGLHRGEDPGGHGERALAGRRRREAAGAILVLGRPPPQANFILVLGNMIEERWAPEWWDGLAKMERGRVRTNRTRSRRAAGHPSCAGDGGRRVVARQTETCRLAAQQSGTTSSGSN
jgi:hypothetical protein